MVIILFAPTQNDESACGMAAPEVGHVGEVVGSGSALGGGGWLWGDKGCPNRAGNESFVSSLEVVTGLMRA